MFSHLHRMDSSPCIYFRGRVQRGIGTWERLPALPGPKARIIVDTGRVHFYQENGGRIRPMPGEQDEIGYREIYNRELDRKTLQFIRSGLARPGWVIRTLANNPGLVIRGVRRIVFDRRALSRRRRHEKAGLVVPPFLFLSITTRCNLDCPGCFMKDRREWARPEMTGAEIASIVGQASLLGVTGIIVLGGEPLLRWDELVPVARAHPDLLFPLFTNGLLIDDRVIKDLAKAVNIIPFISIDGSGPQTDERRGDGVYGKILDTCRLLEKKIPFFGLAVTVTRENFDAVLSEAFIRQLLSTGAGAVGLIQWVPTDPGTGHLVLSPGQRLALYGAVKDLNRRFPALFIAAPGEVDRFGGCLAAGRGFAAVNPWGDLEPCVMVPDPVASLTTVPLEDALRSPFLQAIRENRSRLKANGRCPLRTDPSWVARLRDESGGE